MPIFGTCPFMVNDHRIIHLYSEGEQWLILKCTTGMDMGDRAHSDNIYRNFPPQIHYISVLIFVQELKKDEVQQILLVQ